MAKRRRKTSRRAESGRPRLPAAGVILATMSTVVALATGMFTLRDHIFPQESDLAAAISVPAYQQEVGEVCDEINVNDRRRARDDKAIRKELHRAKTTLAQRNALLDGVRRSSARSGHALATLSGLATPDELAAVQRDTEVVWNRNLARVRGYSMELDRAGTRRRMLAAVDHLAAMRPALARDGDRLRAGLERLGADRCDLEPPIVPKTYTVPPLRRDHEPEEITGDASVPRDEAPVEDEGAGPPPTTGGDGAAPGATTPSSPNVPPSTGGGGGGGDGSGGGTSGANGPVTGGGED